jgi:hypothetical protein
MPPLRARSIAFDTVLFCHINNMSECKVFFVARREHEASTTRHFYFRAFIKVDIEGVVGDLKEALVAEYS